MKLITDYSHYFITTDGKVLSYAKGSLRERALRQDKDGYYVVTLHDNKVRKTKKIHRLIAEAFISNPENLPQVNHIDGVKTNNAIDNLEWCTSKDNSRHCREVLKKSPPGNRGYRKLIESERNEICQKYIPKVYSYARLAAEYDVSEGTIFNVVTGYKSVSYENTLARGKLRHKKKAQAL